MTSASGRDALRADATRERLARCLAAQVRRSTTLVELELGADLGPAAMEILGKAIAGNVSLRRLSFADSNLGDASFASLTHGLRENDAVREINLSGCALTDASGTAVGSILPRARQSPRDGLVGEYPSVLSRVSRGEGPRRETTRRGRFDQARPLVQPTRRRRRPRDLRKPAPGRSPRDARHEE